MDIKQKFEHFVPFEVYYDEIDRKLKQIRSDIAEVKRIKSRLILNMGKDVNCSQLLMIAEELDDHLEMTLEAVEET